jgi:MraZ protein
VLEAAFRGYALNAVDSKSRLSVPSAFRQGIEKRSGNRTLHLGVAEHNDCLIGYDDYWSNQQLNRLAARFEGDYGPAGDDAAVMMCGGVEALAIDDAGRIVLSPVLRELANLKGDGAPALFLGGGNWFQLWNLHDYLARPGLDPRMAKIARAQAAAKGIAL